MSKMGNTVFTSTVFRNTVLALALFAVAGVPALEAADCDTRYRIWQDGNNTFFKYGEKIVLAVGDKVDLYIHAYPSRSEHPYSASADIGAPTAFGVGGQRPQDVSRVLRIGDHDPRKGKISLTAIAAGDTALGYQITGVVDPGRLDKVPRGCRIAQVRISARGRSNRVPANPPPVSVPPSTVVESANDAAHQLIMELYTGILRRSQGEARDYPDSFFDQVQRNGLTGLISIAESMAASPEFRSAAIKRTRSALARTGVDTGGLSQGVLENQLLADISGSLYGGELRGDIRRMLAGKLSSCLAGHGGDAICRQLGRDLLSQYPYQERHRDLLRYWR